MKKHFIFKDEKVTKWWTIEMSGKSFEIYYKSKTKGIGISDARSSRSFNTEEECMAEAQKKINEKIAQGYVEGKGEKEKKTSVVNIVAEKLSPYYDQIKVMKSHSIYIFNWSKISSSHKENFRETFEGCPFLDEVEERNIIPFAVAIEFPIKESGKKLTLSKVLEDQEGGELPGVFLYEPQSGRILICEEGDLISEFAESISDLLTEN